MKDIVARLLARPGIAAEMVAASLLANLLALATPLFAIQVLNRYIAHGVDATLATLTVGAVIAVLLELAFRRARLRFAEGLSRRPDDVLVDGVFGMLTGTRSAAMDRLPTVTRQELMAGADNIRAANSAPNVCAILDVPFALLFIGVLYLLSPALALVAAVFVGAAFLIALVSLVSLRGPTRNLQTATGRRNSLAGSALSAADTIRAFNTGDFLRRRWREESRRALALYRVITGRQGRGQYTTMTAQALLSITIYAVGATLVVEGLLDIGALIGANILASRALGPVIKLAQLNEPFAKARQSHNMLAEFARLPRERTQGTALTRYDGGIEFQDLAFIHPGQRVPLFESVSLKLAPGAVLVVAGSNGAGKTTLARLVIGLLDPTRGKILAGGVDLAQFAPEWWRRQIIYLPQEPRFLNATVRENLTAGNPDLDDARLNELIRSAGLSRFLDQSPEGFETQLVNNGDNLSLGIRRRLALARALATDGKLMVIDEPIEGLDAEGANLVIKAMNDMVQQGRTLIAFSHDPQILSAAPQYMDLDSKPVPKLMRRKTEADSEAPAPPVPVPAREAQS